MYANAYTDDTKEQQAPRRRAVSCAALAAWCLLAMIASSLVLHAQSGGRVPAGYFTGSVTREGRAWRAAVLFVQTDTTPIAYVDLPDVAGYGLSFQVRTTGSRVHLERRQPNGSSVILDGEVTNDTIAGTWSGLGIDAGLRLVRSADGAPPVPRNENVTFRNGTVTLAGTLVLPPGRGPFPAVVFVHGSEPDVRRLYLSGANFYARNGVAALIYDKRGVGESTGDWRSASLEDLANDALAGVRLLRSHAEIDPRRIGIDGFSQGGWIAPLASTLSDDVGFIVVGSASGIDPMEQSIFDRANALRGAGYPDSIVARASRLRRRWYDLLMGLGSRKALERDLRRDRDMPWFDVAKLPYPLPDRPAPEGARRLLFFQPIAVWQRVKVPALAYWGDSDRAVPAALSSAIVEGAAALAGNRSVTTRMFANAGHSLILDSPTEGAWDFPRVPPEYPQLKIDWLRSRGIIR